MSCIWAYAPCAQVQVVSLHVARNMVFQCQRCSFCCTKKLPLIKHIFEAHSSEPTFCFTCGINGCIHQFKFGGTYSTWKTHASQKHPDWQDLVDNLIKSNTHQHQNDDTDSCNANPPSTADPDVDDPLSDHPDVEVPSIVGDVPTTNVPCPERAAAMFLLTFKEKYMMPQVAIDFATGAINGIIDNMCDRLLQSIQNDSDIISQGLSVNFQHEDPFSLLRTEYQQTILSRRVWDDSKF